MPGRQAQRLCPAAVFLPPDMAAYARGVRGRDGDLRRRHTAGRTAHRGRGVPGCRRGRATARPTAPDRGDDPGPGRRRAAADLLGRRGVDEVHGQARLDPGQAGRAARRAGRRRRWPSCTRSAVEALWGVGERSAEALRRLGLRTVGDVAQAPVGMLRQALGEAAADHLHELAMGRDPRPVSTDRVDKSIGAETTFDVDVADATVIRRHAAGAGRAGRGPPAGGRARRPARWRSRSGSADFRTLNRSRTLGSPTDVAREIFDVAWQLCREAARAGPAPPGRRPGRGPGPGVVVGPAADVRGAGAGVAGGRAGQRRGGRPVRAWGWSVRRACSVVPAPAATGGTLIPPKTPFRRTIRRRGPAPNGPDEVVGSVGG